MSVIEVEWATRHLDIAIIVSHISKTRCGAPALVPGLRSGPPCHPHVDDRARAQNPSGLFIAGTSGQGLELNLLIVGILETGSVHDGLIVDNDAYDLDLQLANLGAGAVYLGLKHRAQLSLIERKYLGFAKLVSSCVGNAVLLPLDKVHPSIVPTPELVFPL
jgi:hypothetical protein